MPLRLPLMLVAAITLGVAGVAAAGQLNMQPGLWEDVIAAPDGGFHTEQKCYVAKDIANIEAFQKGALASPEQSCRASAYHADGDTITYTLTCTTVDKAQSVSQISATYHATEVTGTVTKNGSVTRLTRRRLGDCSKSSLTQ